MGEKTTYFPIFIEFNVSWQPLIIIEEEYILLCLDTENHFVKYNNVTEIFHFFHFFSQIENIAAMKGIKLTISGLSEENVVNEP